MDEPKRLQKTMDDRYGDGSDHIVCSLCGHCITCGDCKEIGCGHEVEGEKVNHE